MIPFCAPACRLALPALAVAVLAACALDRRTDPRIERVTPATLPAVSGGSIAILGTALDPLVRLDVSGEPSVVSGAFRAFLGDEEVELEGVRAVARDRVEARVRGGAAPGLYDLTLVRPDGRAATLAGALALTADASIAIGSVVAGGEQVVQGQMGVALSVAVENTGAAALDNLWVTPTFHDGLADRSADYVVAPDASNPTALAPGAKATLRFSVDVSPAAALGPVTVDAVALAEAGTGLPPVLAQGAAAPATWTVLEIGGAVLVVETVGAGEETLFAGQQGVIVLVTVGNAGGMTALLSGAGLRMTAGPDDRTADYAVAAPESPPGSVAAGGAVVWAFTVGVSSTATPGAVIVDAWAAGADSQSGAALADGDADAPDAWTITPCPVVLEVIAGPPFVVRGQPGVVVSVAVHNDSTDDAVRIESVDLVFSPACCTATLVGPLVPFDLPPGAMQNASFTVEVSATSPTGLVTIDGAATATVPPGGILLVVDTAEITDTWTVN